MTVKDISGPSSSSVVRGCGAVTTDSHAAPDTQPELFAQTVFHPFVVVPLSRSLFFFFFLSRRLVMLCPAAEAGQTDADGADGSGQVAARCTSL